MTEREVARECRALAVKLLAEMRYRNAEEREQEVAMLAREFSEKATTFLALLRSAR